MTFGRPSGVVAAGLMIALLASPGRSLAHGITATSAEGARAVRVLYADGTPVALSDTSVFAPGPSPEPVYTGTTDEQGFFAFRPAGPGVWRIQVDDGMGHSVTHEITAEASPAQPLAAAPARIPRHHAVVTGLSLIFGGFGWLAFLRARAARPRAG